MKPVEFFMRRPILFWSLVVGVLLAGTIAFMQMPKLEDPVVAVKQAMVIVPYPGAETHGRRTSHPSRYTKDKN